MDSEEIRMRCIEYAMKLPTISCAEDVLAAARQLESFVKAEVQFVPVLASSRKAEPFTDAEVNRIVCGLTL